ncbi:MAG: thermonuclease family protein [Pseudomonadota bacterium]
MNIHRPRYRGVRRRRPLSTRARFAAARVFVPAALLGVFAGLAFNLNSGGPPMVRADVGNVAAFSCSNPVVVDGDTLRCGAARVRLEGIDAPEMPGHCRRGRRCTPGDPYASSDNLRRLVSGRTIACRRTGTDRYGRIVATCAAGGIDLSCEQIRTDHAVRRYAPVTC